jgi:hypothetical protein
MSDLRIGIKRASFRANDAGAGKADAVFAAVRDGALGNARYRCAHCGLESVPSAAAKGKRSSLQVHHEDDDHANNDPPNLTAVCSLDHAVHHIGCDAPSPGGSLGWASQMRIAYLPELTPADVNLWQRAMGAAMMDPEHAEVSKEMCRVRSVLCKPVMDVYGTHHSKDFAAAMAAMTDDEYADRDVGELRVLFHPEILKIAGAEMLADNPVMGVRAWKVIANGTGQA